MRIVQLVQKPQCRGAELFAHQLNQCFRRSGHDARTIYLYPHSGVAQLELLPQDHLLGGNDAHPLERSIGWHPRLLRSLRTVLRTLGPDIVQLNGSRTVKYGALASRQLRLQGSRLIYRNIGDPDVWVRGWRRRWFYGRVVLPRMDGIIAVSRASLQGLQRLHSFTGPMTCIFSAIDGTRLEPSEPRETVRRALGVAPREALAVFLGSLSVEKRLDRLVRIAQRVARTLPDFHLLIVGDGPGRADLEQLVVASGLGSLVSFLGVRRDVGALLAAADLLVLTSDTEGIPAAVLEAGYCGLPVIATRVGALPECVLDGRTGILVDRDDESGFAARMIELLSDPGLRSALGQHAREWIRANFTIEQAARRYLAFYEAVLSAPGSSQPPDL